MVNNGVNDGANRDVNDGGVSNDASDVTESSASSTTGTRPLLLLRDGPSDAALRLVLAHSAGAPMDTPFMDETARVLAEAGVQVVRFEFPYRHARRSGGRRGPIGGRSMGGRVASMLADELQIAGLLCFGYPFHPPDKPARLRTAHLAELRTKTLIVQGTRDPFGSPEEIASYPLSPAIRVHFIDDGDHSLVPRKRSGRSEEEAREEALEVALAFLREL